MDDAKSSPCCILDPQQLRAAYDEFIQNISLVIPVIKVNWSDFRSADEMAEKIRVEYAKLHNIRYVEFGPRSPVSPDSKVSMSSPQSKLTRMSTPPRAPVHKGDDVAAPSPAEKKAAPSPDAGAGGAGTGGDSASVGDVRPAMKITRQAAAAQIS